MHILYDARLLHRPLSGLERVQRNVLRELAAQPEIRRLRAAVTPGTTLPPELAALRKLEIEEVASSEQLLALVSGTDAPDLYHLSWFPDQHPQDLLLPFAARAAVVEVHDAILNRHPEYYASPTSHAWYHEFVRCLVASADRLLVHSDSVRGEIERDLDGDPSIADLAPLAVDPALTTALGAAEVEQRLQRLGLQLLRGRYFAALGKDYPHKDHETLFRAVARLGTDLHVVCAGDKVWHGGADTDRLLASLNLSARVQWISGLDDADVKAVLQGSMGLVYPSREEGFGMPPIEAMALGVPVAAAKAMSIPEVCGDGALLFEPGDVEALASILGDLRAGGRKIEELVRRGRARQGRFTWLECARATVRCYQNALAQERSPDPELWRRAIHVMARCPFSASRELSAWRERCQHAEGQLERLQQQRDSMPPPPSAASNGASAAKVERQPRWSLRRRLGKIRDGLKRPRRR